MEKSHPQLPGPEELCVAPATLPLSILVSIGKHYEFVTRTASCHTLLNVPKAFLHGVTLAIVKSRDIRKCEKAVVGG